MKNEKDYKKFLAHCWSASLAQQCHERDKQTENATDGSYDGAIKQSTLSAVLSDKTALLAEKLSFIGYLKTISVLFKIAFLHKKRKGFVKVIRCVVEEKSFLNTARGNRIIL